MDYKKALEFVATMSKYYRYYIYEGKWSVADVSNGLVIPVKNVETLEEAVVAMLEYHKDKEKK